MQEPSLVEDPEPPLSTITRISTFLSIPSICELTKHRAAFLFLDTSSYKTQSKLLARQQPFLDLEQHAVHRKLVEPAWTTAALPRPRTRLNHAVRMTILDMSMCHSLSSWTRLKKLFISIDTCRTLFDNTSAGTYGISFCLPLLRVPHLWSTLNLW